MGLFSLDIEKFYEELEKDGQELKGIFCIQYPIYCIHANITNNTPDPLDNFDRTIAQFLSHKPDFTSFQIASLLGTSKGVVEYRIDKMIGDGLMVPGNVRARLSEDGIAVLLNKTAEREHRLSYDFYMDGLTLQPLPKSFYTYHVSKLVSENDAYYKTSSTGSTYEVNPFGPDLVHTPPHKSTIIDNVFNIPVSEREQFNIPVGLRTIEDISYTRLSIQLLVSVSSNGTELTKQLVDGFALYSLAEQISYMEAIKRNVRLFEKNIKSWIEDLQFKIIISYHKQDKPIITTNWLEIDRDKGSKNKCFSFSSEDLLSVVEQIFEMKHVKSESIINTDADISINVSKATLLASSNKPKLIGSLIRERDYRICKIEHNAFLLYLYYKTTDEFVKMAIAFKKALNKHKTTPITLSWLHSQYPEFSTSFRQLLVACGEYELLELLDIERHMA